jgi:hypothetical protein
MHRLQDQDLEHQHIIEGRLAAAALFEHQRSLVAIRSYAKTNFSTFLDARAIARDKPRPAKKDK